MKAKIIGMELEKFNQDITMLKLITEYELGPGILYKPEFTFPVFTSDCGTAGVYHIGQELELRLSLPR